ncbi:DUF4153 domain-containing protein [Shimazuella alba]|uniref:DUF4173 domain-containing protein n=1 Tax=Shimazuella alba TaxID=2690964 RepID=A0A6I4VQU5_9BACL|nr:DUF4173 domain-containing protein [Shimazuella alba]MXQ52645.1 DUF4173 domain-containing protein [Shimazuella alba]
MAEPTNLTKQNVILLLGSFILGVIFDYLFFDKTAGISFPIFWILFQAFFYIIFRDKLIFEKNFEWFLTIPIFLLTLTFFLFSSDVFMHLNVLVIGILFIFQSILLTKNNKNPWYKVSFIGEAFIKTIESLANLLVPFKLIGNLVRSKSTKSAYGVVGKVFIGVLFSLPLIGIIIGLLSSADSIFNHWVNEIPNFLWRIDLGDWPTHLFLVCIVFFVIVMYFWALKHPLKAETVTIEIEKKKPIHIDGIITLTILSLINIVYVLFTAIQVSYLFGEAKNLLPKGVTYAQYATEGFHQLVTVTVLNIFIVIFVIYLVQKIQPVIYRIVQILLSVLTVCTSFILLSAFLKLSLYEEVYGYTYTRILVHAFMVLLSLLFIVALIKTWKNDISLLKYYGIIFLVWYITLNYINIDRIIAKQNVERYHQKKEGAFVQPPKQEYDRYGETKYIDLYYLDQLSYDIVPYLLELRKEPSLRPAIDKQLRQIKAGLTIEKENWQSFNLSRYRAIQLLKELN